MNDKWSGMVVNAKAEAGSLPSPGNGQCLPSSLPSLAPPVAMSGSVLTGATARAICCKPLGCDVKGGSSRSTRGGNGYFTNAPFRRIVLTPRETDRLHDHRAPRNQHCDDFAAELTNGKVCFSQSSQRIEWGPTPGQLREWVVEAPLENRVPTTLSNYTQVQFSGCSAYDESSKTTLDPNGGTPLNLKRNGQTVSRGSSPGAGQVTCTYAGPTRAGRCRPERNFVEDPPD